MSGWYKVTLPYSEAGIAGKGKKLQEAFEVAFVFNRAPQDAAMFSRRADDFEHMFYYFTPVAADIVKNTIDSLHGVECSAPEYDDKISLLVGQAGAHDKFLKKKK